MKTLARLRRTLACFGLLSIALVSAARAEFKCDRPHLNRVDTTACAKAAEGADSLRGYVSRTQRIYGLQVSDYARFEGDAPQAWVTRKSQVAPQASVVGRTPTPR